MRQASISREKLHHWLKSPARVEILPESRLDLIPELFDISEIIMRVGIHSLRNQPVSPKLPDDVQLMR